jgi:hypothetical protein
MWIDVAAVKLRGPASRRGEAMLALQWPRTIPQFVGQDCIDQYESVISPAEYPWSWANTFAMAYGELLEGWNDVF